MNMHQGQEQGLEDSAPTFCASMTGQANYSEEMMTNHLTLRRQESNSELQAQRMTPRQKSHRELIERQDRGLRLPPPLLQRQGSYRELMEPLESFCSEDDGKTRASQRLLQKQISYRHQIDRQMSFSSQDDDAKPPHGLLSQQQWSREPAEQQARFQVKSMIPTHTPG
jgi:hypothetical protein